MTEFAKKAFKKLTSNYECSGQDILKELHLQEVSKTSLEKMK